MSELVESVNGIFEKISEVIDLSFFPPGAVCLAAALYWNQTTAFFSGADAHGLGALPGWFQVGGALLGSYVLGLLCFSAGRFLRHHLLRRLSDEAMLQMLGAALAAHGIDGPGRFPREYLDRGAARALHARMWAEIRESPSLRESYRLLAHYWVMTATYDGLAASFLLWAAVILHRAALGAPGGILGAVIVAIGFLGMTAASLREATRLWRAQLDELAATIARAERRD
jgi:hypothetical protein